MDRESSSRGVTLGLLGDPAEGTFTTETVVEPLAASGVEETGWEGNKEVGGPSGMRLLGGSFEWQWAVVGRSWETKG